MQSDGKFALRFCDAFLPENHLKNLGGFVHRTFNSEDLKFFMHCCNIYQNHGGLEEFLQNIKLQIDASINLEFQTNFF